METLQLLWICKGKSKSVGSCIMDLWTKWFGIILSFDSELKNSIWSSSNGTGSYKKTVTALIWRLLATITCKTARETESLSLPSNPILHLGLSTFDSGPAMVMTSQPPHRVSYGEIHPFGCWNNLIPPPIQDRILLCGATVDLASTVAP